MTKTQTRKKSSYARAESENHNKIRNITPKNENQETYLKALKNENQVFVTGVAGTGKTFLAANVAAEMYLNKDIDKIVLTRPNIAAGKSLGFFPGTLEEKLDPWMKPITDTLRKVIGPNKFDNDMKNGNIEIAPFETMRGRSFDNAFIILDEAQNCTIHELKMFLTRVGENSTLVVNGDVNQTDLHENSGLSKIIHMVKKHGIRASVVEFTVDDIIRSDITKNWIIAFDAEGL